MIEMGVVVPGLARRAPERVDIAPPRVSLPPAMHAEGSRISRSEVVEGCAARGNAQRDCTWPILAQVPVS